jgi:hypothetical protein
VAVVGLAHHSLFVTTGISSLFLLPYLHITAKREIKIIATNVLISGLVALLVSAFWVVPFLLGKNNAHFLKENNIEYLFKFESVKLRDFIFHTSPYSYYHGVAFYLGIIVVILFLKRPEKSKKALGAGLLGASITAILLSLGYYGPTPFLNRLPLLDMIPPYRWLDSLSLVGAIGVGVLFKVLGELIPQKIEVNATRKI